MRTPGLLSSSTGELGPLFYGISISGSYSDNKVREDAVHTKPPNINCSRWVRGEKDAGQRYKGSDEKSDRCEEAEYILDTN